MSLSSMKVTIAMVSIQDQIQRRRKRAEEDIAAIENRGQHVAYSIFDVTSHSKQTYRVQIRSLNDLLLLCRPLAGRSCSSLLCKYRCLAIWILRKKCFY